MHGSDLLTTTFPGQSALFFLMPIYFSFLKIHVRPLSFYERPTLAFVFTNKKKSKVGFAFRKKERSKIGIQHLFSSELLQRPGAQSGKSGLTELLPWKLLSESQHPAAVAFSCVCEHLCFILMYFVHSITRSVLRYQKSQESS